MSLTAESFNRKTNTSSPYNISGSSWKEILLRVKNQISQDNLTIVAAGVSFYAFLAIFPAIIAVISIYGLMVEPAQVNKQISQLAGIVPPEAFSIIEERIKNLTESSSNTLGWSTALSLLFALWSANAGMKALFQGISIAYDENEERGLIMTNVLSLLFTLGSIIVIILCMAFIVAFPAIADDLGFNQTVHTVVEWLRWPILALVVFGWYCLIYKYAPAKRRPSLKWVSAGSIFSTVLWILGSAAFSFYVSNFGNYNATYGSISAVVIMLFWLYITNFIILLGAEINSEAAKQRDF